VIGDQRGRGSRFSVLGSRFSGPLPKKRVGGTKNREPRTRFAARSPITSQEAEGRFPVLSSRFSGPPPKSGRGGPRTENPLRCPITDHLSRSGGTGSGSRCPVLRPPPEKRVGGTKNREPRTENPLRCPQSPITDHRSPLAFPKNVPHTTCRTSCGDLERLPAGRFREMTSPPRYRRTPGTEGE
jgi:hypothetical protein